MPISMCEMNIEMVSVNYNLNCNIFSCMLTLDLDRFIYFVQKI